MKRWMASLATIGLALALLLPSCGDQRAASSLTVSASNTPVVSSAAPTSTLEAAPSAKGAAAPSLAASHLSDASSKATQRSDDDGGAQADALEKEIDDLTAQNDAAAVQYDASSQETTQDQDLKNSLSSVYAPDNSLGDMTPAQ